MGEHIFKKLPKLKHCAFVTAHAFRGAFPSSLSLASPYCCGKITFYSFLEHTKLLSRSSRSSWPVTSQVPASHTHLFNSQKLLFIDSQIILIHSCVTFAFSQSFSSDFPILHPISYSEAASHCPILIAQLLQLKQSHLFQVVFPLFFLGKNNESDSFIQY